MQSYSRFKGSHMTMSSQSRLLMGTIAVLVACQGVARAQFGEGAPPGSPGREIIHLTGDLYRFRDVRHYGMFLHTPDGIILVDPTSPDTAAWLKGELDNRFDVPVRYVIYSHAHNDHAPGGEVFADTATFVAHENMARNLVQPAVGRRCCRWRSWQMQTAMAALKSRKRQVHSRMTLRHSISTAMGA